jgi:hypothetical protein
MMQIVLIGIGAGAAAALLFASLASGSLFALILFYLSPLPILIAGMGWNYLAALVAALFGTASLALALDGYFALAFLISIGLPAWWLAYLALLARPVGSAPRQTLEWYPAGRIVLTAALVSAITVSVIAIATFGTDIDSFQAQMRTAVETMLGLRSGAGSELEPEKFVKVEALVKLIPAIVVSALTVVLLINTWLAAKIVKVSGQLHRPWPDLPAITFPKTAPLLLAAALAGIFVPGLPAIVADVFAAALMMAFAVLGLAVLHVVTHGTNARPIVLGGIYVALIIFTWPAIVLALLGLAETVFDLRRRFNRTRSPPTPT